MDLDLLLRSIIIGFSIAAPVGPIGLLVIRRTLAEGRLTGFVTGLGAATADAIYGCIGAFGVTVVVGLLLDAAFWLQLVGGLFLIYLGWRTFRAAPAEHAAAASGGDRLRAYFSTLLLTLTNPATILAFVAIFSSLGLGATSGAGEAATLVAGVFAGSAFWWLALSGGIGMTRTRVTPETMRWINRISGAIIIAFGVAAILQIL
jgi:threonine/homoserine/homoserine lactone efflux protein